MLHERYLTLSSLLKLPGGWFNIEMSSYQYRKSHCGDKTMFRPSYLHNGISYTGTMTSLYWISDQGLALLTLSWDKNWDSHSLVNGYPSFYPRIALVAPSPVYYRRSIFKIFCFCWSTSSPKTGSFAFLYFFWITWVHKPHETTHNATTKKQTAQQNSVNIWWNNM